MDQIFTPEIKKQADEITARYESRRAALLEVLHLLQNVYGYISPEAERAVAGYFSIPEIDVREVITFYSLYRTKPRARIRFHVCRTLSCSLRGSEGIREYLEKKLGIRAGEQSEDGQFSLEEAECLGACELAPAVQINGGEFIGPVTPEIIDGLIEELKRENK